MSQQSFEFCCKFLLQQAIVCRDLEDLVLILAWVTIAYFWLRHFPFLQYDNSVVTEFPLSRQYSVHSSNMYVAKSIPMSQHSFSAASVSWCRDQSFHVAKAFLLWFLLQHVLYYCHLGCDPKSLSRQSSVAT